MAELGDGSARFHHEVGEQARRLGIDVLVPVGEAALGYLEAFDGEAHAVDSPEEAAALLAEIARPGDRVLVKGSRSVGLERVLS
jgi:UDP-N-acetylmuramoyl-tripeptide--D-alanyl-D-alanine ligase